MTNSHIILRPPSLAALVFLAQLLDTSQAHLLPQATTTLPHHALNVVAIPPPPTAAPSPRQIRYRASRRRPQAAAAAAEDIFNTVCGYIGGDSALPATCSAGSHCVLDSEHGAIGCCPNGAASCTTGIFTGCVDFNSGAQSVVDPYVFTCAGSDVCYRNEFAGGFFQYGCGTASDLATSVVATASGITSTLPITSVSVQLTESPTSLATPTSIDPSTGTRSFTRSSASSTSSSSVSSTSGSSSTSTSSTTSSSTKPSSTSQTSSTATNEATSAPASGATESSGNGKNTGAIVGGVIGGLAGLVLFFVLGLYLWRRRKGNVRNGPGPGSDTQYISPMSGNQGFQALHSNQDTYETGMYPHGTTTEIRGGDGVQVPPHIPPAMQEYHQMSPYTTAAAGAATGAAAAGAYGAYSHDGSHSQPLGYEGDQVPLTREIDDFSAGFNHALERIDEHVPESGDLGEYSSSSGEHVNGTMSANNGGGPAGGGIGVAHTHYSGQGYGSIGSPGLDAADAPHEPYHDTQAEQPTSPFGSPGRPLWQQNRRYSRSPMWM
ncbi:uncharacterized protein E0L32_006165 [Thyridium curvatum]|uniref:Uncharacterized protein n=1 Tax=Thyridium curvatum TaxID=1093900 RepID=A0A507ARJ2_9PEZI|nr:uncharacterized protein E0L32_006165 [Thyridium curvatum]TPX13435.1 hypothetical protein E0L32_006165 [Thyridium curvatum]